MFSKQTIPSILKILFGESKPGPAQQHLSDLGLSDPIRERTRSSPQLAGVREVPLLVRALHHNLEARTDLLAAAGMASSSVDAAGEPIPTSSVLMAASKHIAVRCRSENMAFITCKKKDANPEKCLDKGRQVTACVVNL